jgi:hypothetical protein
MRENVASELLKYCTVGQEERVTVSVQQHNGADHFGNSDKMWHHLKWLWLVWLLLNVCTNLRKV